MCLVLSVSDTEISKRLISPGRNSCSDALSVPPNQRDEILPSGCPVRYSHGPAVTLECLVATPYTRSHPCQVCDRRAQLRVGKKCESESALSVSAYIIHTEEGNQHHLP